MSDETFPQTPVRMSLVPSNEPVQQPEQDEPYLFDDFFAVDNDPGITIGVKVKGRNVPITLRRGLSVADRAAAQSKAIKRHLDPSGRVIFDGLDETVLQDEMLVRSILSWPFTHRDGSPVPVTIENIRKLLGGADEIAGALQTIDTQGEAALVPFAKPSPEA